MTIRTLDELLRTRAAALPDKVCLRTPDGELASTYGELDRRASAFAAGLRRRGCRAGERVLLGLGNRPEFFTALFGCARGGLIAVPVDTSLAPDEIRTLVEHADPAAVLVEEETAGRFEGLVPEEALMTVTDALDPGSASDPEAAPEAVSPASPALLLYTSGTTGEPKGVLFSHAALSAKIEAIVRWFGCEESTTSLCLLPTHFGHGLICNCLSTFGCGGTLVLAAPFNLDLLRKLGAIVDRFRVNTFSSVPTVVRLLNRYAKHRDWQAPASLRFVTCASAPLWAEEIEEFERSFGAPLLNCYGLTETSGWSACSPRSADRNLASVGKSIGCEIRVVTASGGVAGPGEEGEIEIRGPSLMMGYYKNPARTAEVMRDGWFATGDVGALDETGAVFLVSRIKELIIRAGKNIYPAEVDKVLASHAEVVEACTFGLDDPLLGERVAACVVRAPGSGLTEAALIAHAQNHLAGYKCPQRIKFVDGIPKTSRGKVNRSNLRSLFESRETP